MVSSSVLGQIVLFSGCTPKDLDFIRNKMAMRNYKRGEVIFHQFDEGDRLFIVIQGLVKISKTSLDGREKDLAIMRPGDCFGELSLLDGEPRSAAASAVEPTQTGVLLRNDFLELLQRNPNLSAGIIRLLATRFRYSDHAVEELAFLDVPQRVSKKLIELAEVYKGHHDTKGGVIIPTGQEELSKMVGASRETVSRVLSSYRDRGLLLTSHKQITIYRLDVLHKMTQ